MGSERSYYCLGAFRWDGRHLQLLQEKLNTHLSFIETGEISIWRCLRQPERWSGG
ncbi:DUF6572 domain-containing protein [Cupriavidus necator]|uniref:DUF6572 domain-containing protein n=1 Tax=Cupriavidus necator TaxID=106590 RepID=UPI003C6C0BA4